MTNAMLFLQILAKFRDWLSNLIHEQRKNKLSATNEHKGHWRLYRIEMNSETQRPTVGDLLVLNMPSLDEADAASLLHVTARCLKERRLNGTGPDYIRIGQRIIRYTPLAIAEYAAKHEVKSGAA